MPLLDVLAAWNPWWRDGKVPDAFCGQPRKLTQDVLDALPQREVIALVGVRRSGKTTLLYQIIRHAIDTPESVMLVNLEDPALQGVGLDEILAAHRHAFGPDALHLLALDEVQEVPGWEAWVNARYEQRAIPKMAVTGSSMMGSDLARLLTGRNISFAVRPFSFSEVANAPPQPWPARQRQALLHAFNGYLHSGGFPEAVLREPPDRRRLLQQYFLDILARDLAHRRGVQLQRIEPFAAYLAETTAALHTGRSLARATGLAPDTARSYLAMLEEVLLVRTVPRFAWSSKPAAQEQAPFKVYLCDPGLRHAVTRTPDTGRLAETVVANALLDRHHQVMCWQGRREVDFVVPDGGRLNAYQVTFGDTLPEREAKGLNEFSQNIPRAGHLTLLTKDYEGEMDGIPAVPVWKWLIEM